MINVNAIWLFSLIGFALIALILLVLLIISNRKNSFSFLRNFPFELNKNNPQLMNIFKPLMYVLTGLAFSPIFFITPLMKDFGDLGFLSIFVTCIFGLSAISNCLLFFFDAKYTKVHMVLVTISMCLTLLANALSTLLSILIYKGYADFNESHIASIILAIVSGLIALGLLAIIINPKLMNWAKLESQDNNGEKTFGRGKIFVLALSEWLTIALSIIGEIIFFLSLIK